MDRLIVIDGLDGSGKATQTALLADALKNQDVSVKQITFPNYQSRSSELVKMYLSGEISTDPNQVNAYAAASFYAADRYISYLTDWREDYEDGVVILSDRYVSSNAIHQMVKLDASEWDLFLDWLFDYEYEKLGLPEPDRTLYLDMDPVVSQSLMQQRYQGDESKKDIHESNFPYLLKCREAALYAATRLGWTVISCSKGNKPYSIEEIAKMIRKEIGVDTSLC